MLRWDQPDKPNSLTERRRRPRPIKEAKSDSDREMLQERLAKPAGGLAIIRVGGASELEVKERNDGFGFDAQSGTYRDLIDVGIVDPTKVLRVALQNAASIAGLLITTEAMVAVRPDDATAMPQGADLDY